jgi:hypothetical protein
MLPEHQLVPGFPALQPYISIVGSIVSPTIEPSDRRTDVIVVQLSLFGMEEEQEEEGSSIVSPTIEPSDRPRVNNGCINEYNKGLNWYYRYTYRHGKKYRHKHIGPVGDSLASWKAVRAREKIGRGESMGDILHFLGSPQAPTLELDGR